MLYLKGCFINDLIIDLKNNEIYMLYVNFI